MAAITVHDLRAENERLEKDANRARHANRSLRQKMDEMAAAGVEMFAMLGTAFLSAAAMEKYRSDKDNKVPNVMGMPLDAIGGSVLTVIGLMEWAGDQSGIVEAVGEGMLASFAARQGAQMGADSRKKSGNKVAGDPAAVGALPAAGQGGYGPQAFQQFLTGIPQGAPAPQAQG